MNATRLPSGDHAASETLVGNRTGVPPMVTVSDPSEMSGVPAAYRGPAGVEAAAEGVAGAAAGAMDVEGVALGVATGRGEDFPHADASSATDAAAAALTMMWREAVRLTCGSSRRNGVTR